MKAFAGESMARNRYCFFASIAKKEGLIEIADTFILTSMNEKEHAEVFYKFLDGEDIVIQNASYPSCYGNTKENLLFGKFLFQTLFGSLEIVKIRRSCLVIVVKRIAAGNNTVAGSRGTIAESTADFARFKRLAGKGISADIGIRKNQSAVSDHIRHIFADNLLGDGNQVFLQTAVS